MADCFMHAHSSPCPHCAHETQEQAILRRRRMGYVWITVGVLMLVTLTTCAVHTAFCGLPFNQETSDD